MRYVLGHFHRETYRVNSISILMNTLFEWQLDLFTKSSKYEITDWLPADPKELVHGISIIIPIKTVQHENVQSFFEIRMSEEESEDGYQIIAFEALLDFGVGLGSAWILDYTFFLEDISESDWSIFEKTLNWNRVVDIPESLSDFIVSTTKRVFKNMGWSQ